MFKRKNTQRKSTRKSGISPKAYVRKAKNRFSAKLSKRKK